MRFRTYVAILGLMMFGGKSWSQERIRIAAASDMKYAMDSLVQAFEAKHAGVVDVTYGSSGKLTEQIFNGAPFDIFFSADMAYVELLRSRNQAASEIYPYATGHLALWSSKVNPETRKMQTLTDASINRIAIANPQHAPYGERAMEALKYFGLTDAVKAKLVYGQNVAQAAQFVLSGAADAAIIGLSTVRSKAMQQSGGAYYLIPEQSHEPLVQGAVITRYGSDKKLVHAFFEYIKSPAAVAILSYYGFSKPE
ncbi:MAG TPA: molybdate ABC transporter substrate-binding protein [Cyclobacteriaceae bacterium]